MASFTKYGTVWGALHVWQVVRDHIGPLRIMALAEGWAMWRRRGAAEPGVWRQDELRKLVPGLSALQAG